MKVSELMSHAVRHVSPTDSIADAAMLMAERDVGILPVVDDQRVVGVVTDRDLVVRGLAVGLRGRAHIAELMSMRVVTCRPEDEIDAVLEQMAAEQVRRLPVVSPDGRLVGLFSLVDAARTEEYQEAAAQVLSRICRPHGHHCQKRHAA